MHDKAIHGDAGTGSRKPKDGLFEGAGSHSTLCVEASSLSGDTTVFDRRMKLADVI